MKRIDKKKFGIGMLIGAVVTMGLAQVVIFVGLFVLVIISEFTNINTETSTDINHYETIDEYQLETGLIVFPEGIPRSATNTEYKFYYNSGLFDDYVELYLQCIYNDEDYEKEVKRLEDTYKEYKGSRKELLRDKEGKFNYPAYIAIENHFSEYEYALLTGENEITYIYTAYRFADDISFDMDYLPSDYMENEGEEFGSGYSIYITEFSKDGIAYDYTRDRVVGE